MPAIVPPASASVPSPSFAHKLTHTDKHVRNRAVKEFIKYATNMMLTPSSSSSSVVGHESTHQQLQLLLHLKLSKALFYCFWMADKQAPQIHLADTIAQLVSVSRTSSSDIDSSDSTTTTTSTTHPGFSFLSAFFHILAREWHGIDRLRLDKFYMLLRTLHAAALRFLARSNWSPHLVRMYTQDVLKATLLSRGNDDAAAGGGGNGNGNGIVVPDSLRYHTVEALFQELDKVLKEEISSTSNATTTTTTDNNKDNSSSTKSYSSPSSPYPNESTVLTLLHPMLTLFASSTNPALRTRIQSEIFNGILTHYSSVESSSSSDGEEEVVEEEEGKRAYLTLIRGQVLARHVFRLASSSGTTTTTNNSSAPVTVLPASRKDMYAFAQELNEICGSGEDGDVGDLFGCGEVEEEEEEVVKTAPTTSPTTTHLSSPSSSLGKRKAVDITEEEKVVVVDMSTETSAVVSEGVSTTTTTTTTTTTKKLKTKKKKYATAATPASTPANIVTSSPPVSSTQKENIAVLAASIVTAAGDGGDETSASAVNYNKNVKFVLSNNRVKTFEKKTAISTPDAVKTESAVLRARQPTKSALRPTPTARTNIGVGGGSVRKNTNANKGGKKSGLLPLKKRGAAFMVKAGKAAFASK